MMTLAASNGMEKFYFNRIKAGKMKWTAVPNLWKQSTIDYIESQGYVCNPDGTISKAA